MNNAEKGKLLVISGPSGAGKSTVIGKLMELREDVCFSVSVTTRPARPNEEDGKDYFFVTPQRFQELGIGLTTGWQAGWQRLHAMHDYLGPSSKA